LSTKVTKPAQIATVKKQTTRPTRRSTSQPDTLTNVIIASAQDKKAEQIVMLDLRELPDAVADFFIICEADNTTQVKAIAEHIAETTREKCGEKPWHLEGLQNMEWVLIDYVDVVVHVFYKKMRTFYNIEQLWGDAKITHIQ
jgi:ribosome-associated protein